jgi:AraC-like DNA-binding protein
MSNLKHLEELTMISHFAAPDVDVLNPYSIEDNTELIEIITGGTVFFAGKEFRKGTIFWHIHGDHTIHKTIAKDPYRCMVYRFKMSKNTKRTMPRVSSWNNFNEMNIFFSQSLRFYHTNQYNTTALSQYLYSRLYWEAIYQDNITGTEQELPASLQRAVSFIEKRFHLDMSVDDLARYARVSKPYLFALFKEHLNTSPHKYINNYRMNHARSLLAGSNKSIKETAHESGYSSLASFYRIFNQHHDLSPAAYRNKNNPYQKLPI